MQPQNGMNLGKVTGGPVVRTTTNSAGAPVFTEVTTYTNAQGQSTDVTRTVTTAIYASETQRNDAQIASLQARNATIAICSAACVVPTAPTV